MSGYVYIAGPVNELHKIGKTLSVEIRIQQLSSQMKQEVKLVHAISNPLYKLESYLHLAFRHKRDHGEWFKLTPEDIADLKQIVIENELPESIIESHKRNTQTVKDEQAEKKKGGMQIFVGPELAEAIRRAAAMEGMRISRWFNTRLKDIVLEIYHERAREFLSQLERGKS